MKFSLRNTEQLEIGNNYYTKLIYHALNDLGHSVLVTADLGFHDHMKIIYLMSFWDNRRMLESLEKNDGNNYVVFCQEIVTEGGINHWDVPPHTAEILAAGIRNARLVITPYRASLPAIRALNSRAAYIPLSFHPSVEQVRLARERSFDVFFFGHLDKEGRRQGLLDRLRERGLSVTSLGLGGTVPQRDSLIGCSRLCLNIGPKLPLTHVSPRVPMLANNRACCVSTRVADPDGYLDYATVADDDDALVDLCHRIARERLYEDLGNAAYRKLKERPSFTETLGDVLNEYL